MSLKRFECHASASVLGDCVVIAFIYLHICRFTKTQGCSRRLPEQMQENMTVAKRAHSQYDGGSGSKKGFALGSSCATLASAPPHF